MHPMLNTAIKAARRAGNIILRASRDLDRLSVETKAPNDFVSEVDRAAEQTIVETLLEAYPKHGILAEEFGDHGRNNADADHMWIIDPLDGTTNFLHGFPQYCISIALQQEDRIMHAVIFDPERNHLFTASRGAGAFLNDRRIRVSKRRELRESLVATGFPFRDMSFYDQYMPMLGTMIQKTAGVRRQGAAALDLAYVAAGWFDGYWEMRLMPWDIAAGSLLVVEAGGLVGNLAGEEGYLESGDILAGNPRIFGQMVQTLAPHLAKATNQSDTDSAPEKKSTGAGGAQ